MICLSHIFFGVCEAALRIGAAEKRDYGEEWEMPFVRDCELYTGEKGAYNITEELIRAVTDSGVEDGVALIYSPHTTTGITITENTDPKALGDLFLGVEAAFPNKPEYTHNEGNSFAHIRSSMMGTQIFVFVDGGWPMLGPWQAVYFFEFDGPRRRHFQIKVIAC